MDKKLLSTFIMDINSTWDSVLKLASIIRDPNYPLKFDRRETHDILHTNNQWMKNICEDFYAKYSTEAEIVYNPYIYNNLYSILFQCPEYHIYYRFPYDLLNMINEREKTSNIPENPLLNLDDSKIGKNSSSFKGIVLTLQRLLDSTFKHLTHTDYSFLQAIINYNKNFKLNSGKTEYSPLTKKDILAISGGGKKAWASYIRYYLESKIFEPIIIINPFQNRNLYSTIIQKSDQENSKATLVNYQLGNSQLFFSNNENLSQNRIEKIILNSNLYSLEPKILNPPNEYEKTPFSLIITPTHYSCTEEEVDVMEMYKFLSETKSLLHFKNIPLGFPEKEITRKISIEYENVKEIITRLYSEKVIFSYSRINFINKFAKRILIVKKKDLLRKSEKDLSNSLKQLPFSVQFLGKEENIYFINLSELLVNKLKDFIINLDPRLGKNVEIYEYSYPDPEMVLSKNTNFFDL